MPNALISDLPSGASVVRANFLLEVCDPATGDSYKISFTDFLFALGIPSSTEALLPSASDGGDNILHFVTDARKVGESAPGTGSLALSVGSSSRHIVSDGTSVTT